MKFKRFFFLIIVSQLLFGVVIAEKIPEVYQGSRKYLYPGYYSNYAKAGINPNRIQVTTFPDERIGYNPYFTTDVGYDSEVILSSPKLFSSRRCTPFQKNSLEIRLAAFIPSSRLFREIYHDVSANFQIEGATRFNQCLDIWANFDWFTRNGKSLGLHSPTKVRISNVGCGVKFLYPFCNCFTAYVGVGPSIGWIKIKNRSCCPHSSQLKTAIGGILKTGVYYYVTRCIYLDLFFDYLYQPVHFEKDRNVGGIKTGLGIGARF